MDKKILVAVGLILVITLSGCSLLPESKPFSVAKEDLTRESMEAMCQQFDAELLGYAGDKFDCQKVTENGIVDYHLVLFEGTSWTYNVKHISVRPPQALKK